MQAESTTEFEAEMAALGTADQAVEAFSQRMSWAEEALFQVRLVVEEVLMNVISHGSDGVHRPRIRLRLAQDGDLLSMEIADTGIAYDPLQAPPPDLEADIEDRPIGGLGVHLMREMMDSLAYHREGDWNRLTMTKKVR